MFNSFSCKQVGDTTERTEMLQMVFLCVLLGSCVECMYVLLSSNLQPVKLPSVGYTTLWSMVTGVQRCPICRLFLRACGHSDHRFFSSVACSHLGKRQIVDELHRFQPDASAQGLVILLQYERQTAQNTVAPHASPEVKLRTCWTLLDDKIG